MIWIVLSSLLACSTPAPTPTAGPAANRQNKQAAKGHKQKGKQKSKQKAKAAGKMPKPIGVAGPLLGALSLTESEGKTEAKLKLTFEGGDEEVLLGKVPGTCAQTEPTPVGPEGKEQLPIWSVICTFGEKKANIVVAQVGDLIITMREEPKRPGMTTPRFRPVRRTKLAKGAMLYREGQPVPVAKANAPANPGAVPGAPDEVPLPEGAQPVDPTKLKTVPTDADAAKEATTTPSDAGVPATEPADAANAPDAATPAAP